MPTPIIDLQRRLSIVGAIRCGERTTSGAPRKLETFRITSPSEPLVSQAAGLFGGAPSQWQSPSGPEWQVTTTTSELTVLVMPGYSIRQTYELWEGATRRTRVCDGVETTEGQPCLCEAEGEDKCDLYTRLVVALPELDTVLGWRLITKGWNAGTELPTLMTLIQGVSNGKPFVPAKLRLIERHSVKNGQKVRFVVPTLDLGAGFAALATARDATGELGYTPAPARELEAGGVTVTEGLEQAERKTTARSGRSAAPIADTGDDFDTAPIPQTEPAESSPARTAAQSKKLDVLVSKLRGNQTISTDHLWAAVATVRSVDVEQLITTLNGRDIEGMLHWAPLRDALSKAEASDLIERLEAKAAT